MSAAKSVVVIGLASLAVAAPIALGAPATTAPGSRVTIGVRITDTSVNVFDSARMARGTIATFYVKNAGKKVHNFKLLGHKTKNLGPGKTGSFTVELLARGAFPYGSTLDKGKRFHGYFVVY